MSGGQTVVWSYGYGEEFLLGFQFSESTAIIVLSKMRDTLLSHDEMIGVLNFQSVQCVTCSRIKGLLDFSVPFLSLVVLVLDSSAHYWCLNTWGVLVCWTAITLERVFVLSLFQTSLCLLPCSIFLLYCRRREGWLDNLGPNGVSLTCRTNVWVARDWMPGNLSSDNDLLNTPLDKLSDSMSTVMLRNRLSDILGSLCCCYCSCTRLALLLQRVHWTYERPISKALLIFWVRFVVLLVVSD